MLVIRTGYVVEQAVSLKILQAWIVCTGFLRFQVLTVLSFFLFLASDRVSSFIYFSMLLYPLCYCNFVFYIFLPKAKTCKPNFFSLFPLSSTA